MPEKIASNPKISEAEALENLMKISAKIDEFNKLPTRHGNIEKITEILNMVNDQMLDIIMHDNDYIYYGLIFNIVTLINYYKNNKHVYADKPVEDVSEFEKLLDTSSGMIKLYLQNHYDQPDGDLDLEDKFDILIK
jgi:hypothetical protein